MFCSETEDTYGFCNLLVNMSMQEGAVLQPTTPDAYLPFGGGVRLCVGRPFANQVRFSRNASVALPKPCTTPPRLVGGLLGWPSHCWATLLCCVTSQLASIYAVLCAKLLCLRQCAGVSLCTLQSFSAVCGACRLSSPLLLGCTSSTVSSWSLGRCPCK